MGKKKQIKKLKNRVAILEQRIRELQDAVFERATTTAGGRICETDTEAMKEAINGRWADGRIVDDGN